MDVWTPFLNQFWPMVKELLAIASPILIAWIGLQSNSREKNNEKYRKLKEEVDAKEKKEQQDRYTKQDQAISKLSEEVKQLNLKIDELNIPDLTKQLTRISDITNANFEYSQSLSRVITTLGDVLENADGIPSSGDIHRVVTEHKLKEQKIISTIVKILY